MWKQNKLFFRAVSSKLVMVFWILYTKTCFTFESVFPSLLCLYYLHSVSSLFSLVIFYPYFKPQGTTNQNHNEVSLHTWKNSPYKKTRSSKGCHGYGNKETLLPWRWECRHAQLLWKNRTAVSKILKIDLPYDPEIPLLKEFIFLKDYKNTNLQGYMHSSAYCSQALENT